MRLPPALSLALSMSILGVASPAPLAAANVAPGLAPAAQPAIRHVFVVMMENENAEDIYGRPEAPYLNRLLRVAARAENFTDVLPHHPSGPHYIWLEAGTNAFADHTFHGDRDPSARRSTGSAEHLVNLIEQRGLTWTTYQQSIDGASGACPIVSVRATHYAAKHNPFVYFRDVAGNPPSRTSPRCVAHTRPMSQLAGDLASGEVSAFNLLTPDLCHDMHGARGCRETRIRDGDRWLEETLPAILAFADTHQGVVFVTWDEAEGKPTQPFVVAGPHVKRGYASRVHYDLSSVLKSLQEIFDVGPLLGHAADASTNDLADLFEPGAFP